MKVIISSYLIFLSFYIAETARSSLKINPNTTIITANTTAAVNINNDSSDNNNKTNSISSSKITSADLKTPLQQQKNNKIQEIQLSYFQTRPTTTSEIKRESKNIAISTTITSTTSRYNNQHIELPTYPQQLYPHSHDDNNKKILNSADINIVQNVLVSNENEIDYNNHGYNDSNNSVKLKYGMKTITKNFKNLEDSRKQIEKSKKRQALKQKKTKPDIPTKSPFLPSDDTNNVPKKYISTTTTRKPRTTTPLQKIISNSPIKYQLHEKPSLKSLSDGSALICPKETEAHFNLFAANCKSDFDCINWNKEFRCCTIFGSRNCHKGVPRPLEESPHSPILGIIPRKCPERPLAELFWDLKTCDTDDDCWPRVCCPDGKNRYCRTSTPEYESVPFQIGRPLAYVSEYLECTPPPPPIFDLHPKSCNSTLDCFPNVCCQEAGKKNCRPPKKSVLSFMANFFNTGLVRRLTNNLVIKK